MINWIKGWFKGEKKDDVFTPPETRIEITTLRNGEVIYAPQIRRNGNELWLNINHILYGQTSYSHLNKGTLEYSQAAIDLFIEAKKKEWNARVTKVEYVKYP